MTAGGWRPRHPPRPSDPVAAFPAPFVPDLVRGLRRRGFRFLDAEPAYARLPAAEAARHGYGTGSFRTGEVVTAAAARRWLDAAAGEPPAAGYAKRDGRVIDLLRPAIEPGGFRNLAEAEALRRVTVTAVRRAVAEAHTLVLALAAAEGADDLAAALAVLRRLGRARLLLVPLGAADLRPLAAAVSPDGAVDAAPRLGGDALAAAFAAAARTVAPPEPGDDEWFLDRFAPGGRADGR